MKNSTVPNPCRLVWEIAEQMRGAPRREVIAECVRRGVNPATASTQYQRWRQYGSSVR